MCFDNRFSQWAAAPPPTAGELTTSDKPPFGGSSADVIKKSLRHNVTSIGGHVCSVKVKRVIG